MIINDKVVFIPIPKNASWSVEDTCIQYGLDLKYPNKLWENSINLETKDPQKHMHTTINNIIDYFGVNFEFVCIVRNSTDRFISAWKYFVGAMVNEVNNELGEKIKNVGNDFLINFFKENYLTFHNVYNSLETRKTLLKKLVDELGISKEYQIDDEFLKRYSMHIFTFVSQYQWIQNDKVKVIEFNFDNMNEFEEYISKKFDINFKLIHRNQNKLDWCAVTKTPELIEFVEKYIDGALKKNKTII